ncbi:MAG: hypothetical protein WDZ46_09810 [Solirubrobacterales bacterium]
MLKTRPGDANIGRVAVAFPPSEFLDQANLDNICTRVQFAAGACPPSSVYGYAKAWSPLLDRPLEGPVHLRSSDNNLPDMAGLPRGRSTSRSPGASTRPRQEAGAEAAEGEEQGRRTAAAAAALIPVCRHTVTYTNNTVAYMPLFRRTATGSR